MKEVEVAFPVRVSPSDARLRQAAAASAGIPLRKISGVTVLRRSMDARSREILYRYRVRVAEAGETLPPEEVFEPLQDVSAAEPVIVIGAGPSGLFAALTLIRRGLRPVILERGKDVHGRKYDMAAISREGRVDPDSNYCFGEGGAGTFSDGKLYTRSVKRGNVRSVLQTFVHYGADPSILTDAHPHLGSDRLPKMMESLRKEIEACGGEYHFGTRVTDLENVAGGWKVTAGTVPFSAAAVILATGHSANDVYRLFQRKGWELETKGFALGVRAEHPQQLINDIQYHGRWRPFLPPAEYSLVQQVDGRGVFSFCMCPGGILVPSMTEEKTVVLNGMSNSRRNSRWANAGIVTSVEPEDVERYYAAQCRPLHGVEAMLTFREEAERRTFECSGSFRAPAQRMTDFVRSGAGRSVVTGLPETSYAPGTFAADLHEVLPSFVADRLKKAFPLFDKKMKGYHTSEALLLAVESRTSSPVRIPRDPETLDHVSQKGIFPCGEGAGYAGGIVSSAIDGINAAEAVSRSILRHNRSFRCRS